MIEITFQCCICVVLIVLTARYVISTIEGVRVMMSKDPDTK